jgi:hypothetical protein
MKVSCDDNYPNEGEAIQAIGAVISSDVKFIEASFLLTFRD